MSDKWNETETYMEKFYNNAQNKIPSNILDEIHKIDFRNIPKGQPRQTNKELRLILRSSGWTNHSFRANSSKFSLDDFKDDIGLERQFRTYRDLVYDVLKLQLGYNLGELKAGVIINYDENVKVKGGNSPYIQELDRKIEEFQEVINFDIPLLVIGLKEKTFLAQKEVPERHVKYPAKDRGPSDQRYLEKLRRKRALERAKK